jgi:hypothetical protein
MIVQQKKKKMSYIPNNNTMDNEKIIQDLRYTMEI